VMRTRLLQRSVAAAAAVAAVATVLWPVGQAVAAPAGDRNAAPRACSWRLDTRLPLPAGLTSASITATDGATGFTGVATNFSMNDEFHAVVWQAGRASVLPTPAGASSMAFGMNRGGDVVGVVFPGSGGGNQPVLWRAGRLVPLGTAPAVGDWVARDINDAGLIVGDVRDSDTGNQAVVWSAAEPAKFAFVRSAAPISSIAAVTEAGVLAGNAVSTTGTTTAGAVVAGTVADGLHVVPSPAGAAGASVSAANGGYLAGQYVPTGGTDPNAVLWSDQAPQVLSKDNTEALGVNSHGLATGVDFTTGGAVVWSGGTEQRLPVISPGPASTFSVGNVVTEDGAVGGSVTLDNGDSRPVVWHCR
jgi:uncharacterized membrane protein